MKNKLSPEEREAYKTKSIVLWCIISPILIAIITAICLTIKDIPNGSAKKQNTISISSSERNTN